jgi:hypothetical protein
MDIILDKHIHKIVQKIAQGLLIPVNRIHETDELWKYTNPIEAQQNAFKYFGRTAILYKSNRKNKKFQIYDPNNKKWVHFGQIGFEDYLKHKDDQRMMNYTKRAMNIKGNWKENPYSANNLSQKILWS